MSSVIVAMLVIVGIALAVGAVVAVGMRGKWREHNPVVADRLGAVGKHLNGDAAAPDSFVQFYETSAQKVKQVTKR